MRLTPDQLPSALGKPLASVYLVSGDEPLLVGEAADAIRESARRAGFAERSVFFIDRTFDWEELRQSSQSMSLFAERRLFELRMPTGKPDKGAATLIELVRRPPPDLLFLIVSGKIDQKGGEPAWVRAVDDAGVWVSARPVDSAALPGWLRARARALDLDMDAAAAALIVERVEGNLLAAKQELDRLLLLADGAPIGVDLVQRSVGDSARYDVFQLAEAAAAGNAARALHVLLGLKAEGVEPTLILWALVRELRGLWQARERQRLRSTSRGSAWNLAAPPKPAALARGGKLPLARLLRQAALTDRIVKGLARGDAWSAIAGLAAAMAGALQARPDSGRVAV